MIAIVSILKKEHSQIITDLKQIEKYIGDVSFGSYKIVSKILKELGNLWDSHERKEERLFDISKKSGIPFPNEAMLLREHRELRGHWKVINDSMNSDDLQKFYVALDTDGRMLIQKFRNHIQKEETFFNTFNR